jgi:hypothetical protein
MSAAKRPTVFIMGGEIFFSNKYGKAIYWKELSELRCGMAQSRWWIELQIDKPWITPQALSVARSIIYAYLYGHRCGHLGL